MIDFKILKDNGYTPTKLMETYNITEKEMRLIQAAPDRDFLAKGADKRRRGSLYHRALADYDFLKALINYETKYKHIKSKECE